MKIPSRVKNRLRDKKTLLILAIIGVALFLRFFAFTSVPAGLNQDELSAAYESYSLVQNGTDRWGNEWPVYFISWGSGQNVLLSYLMIPIVAILGLTPVAVRLLPALLGVGSVVLLYFTVKKAANVNTALLSAAILAVSPWAVVGSRWGLESNILPFFMLLGVFSFLYSQGSRYARYLIPISLVPFAVALYAYAIAIFVIPLFLIGLFILCFKEIRQQKLLYAISAGVFLLCATPILLFFVVNSILHSSPAFVAHLPFSVPLLTENRLSQIQSHLLSTNLTFLASGFNDLTIQNGLTTYVPLALSPLPFVIAGTVLSFTEKLKHMRIFAAWAIAGCALFLVAPLNLNRANLLLIPFIVLAAYAVVWLLGKIQQTGKRRWVIAALVVVVSVYCGLYYNQYFHTYNTQAAAAFRPGFETALAQAQDLAEPGDNIYVSNLVNLNYMYTLFALKADSKDFSQNAKYHIEDATIGKFFTVEHYNQYFFDPHVSELQQKPFTYVTIKGDNLPCAEPDTTYQWGMWYVGRCLVPAPVTGTTPR